MAELERRLNRSSRNSSLPPSQDPPSAPSRPRGEGLGRKRGGQQGHEGRYRRLLPPEQVDEFIEHWPDRCRSCAYEFAETERVDAVEPSRRQVAELPPIAVRVSEHRLRHRVCCPGCAAITTADSPAAARWAFGPRLQAAVVTLAVRNRVSRRDATELVGELFGVELSTGTVDAIVQRAGEALAAPHTRLEQEIKRYVCCQHRRDRMEDRRQPPDALGRAHPPNRGVPDRGSVGYAAEAQTMLGERYEGIVCSDRWVGYDYLDPSRRQLCWAHLLRDFTAHSEAMSEQQAFGNAGLVVAHDLFEAWRQFQQDGDRAALQTRISAASRQSSCPNSSTHPARAPRPSTTGSSLPQPRSNAGPPSGHSATPTDVELHEQPRRTRRPPRRRHLPQALARHPVRNIGERSVERLLSASVTCRLRKQSLFAYLTQVTTAHARGDPIPALS